jgi:3-oxoacyl-[acyl-carrier protein] reductase
MSGRKVAIITGGSRGIGYGIAERLAREGYNLAIFGTSDESRVREALEGLRVNGVEVLYVQGSLGSDQDRQKLIDLVSSRFGRIDVLINNAGVAQLVE